MIRSIHQLYGIKLAASDGAIGHVKDCYFDDQSWAVRYLVADTGSWLSGRQVLLAPHAFGPLELVERRLVVNLTRQQIEDSPAIESRKPLSRQYEEEYYSYYGWPSYWQGGGLWGLSGFPILVAPTATFTSEPAQKREPGTACADVHLRSTQAVTGYQLQATDGTVGHLCDFTMDDRSWAIGQLVIKTGHRFTGKEVQLPTSTVERISYDESKVFVKLTAAAVEQSPAHDRKLLDAAA